MFSGGIALLAFVALLALVWPLEICCRRYILGAVGPLAALGLALAVFCVVAGIVRLPAWRDPVATHGLPFVAEIPLRYGLKKALLAVIILYFPYALMVAGGYCGYHYARCLYSLIQIRRGR